MLRGPYLRVAAITALVFLVVGLAREGAAQIVLDNDVTLDWQNESLTAPQPASVFGAPRLVRDWQSLAITLEATGSPRGVVQLSFYTQDFTRVCLRLSCQPVSRPFEQQDLPAARFTLADFVISEFSEFTSLDEFIALLPTPGIVVINGRFVAAGERPDIRLTVSGDGNQIITGRIGDIGIRTGDALDVPTRSIELMRALAHIDTTWFRTRVVNLDVTAPSAGRVAVGFTHAFDFPLDPAGTPIDRIEGAVVRLRLANARPSAANDFILLDRGVRRVSNERPRIPLIFLRDLEPPRPVGDTQEFSIELTKVPISFLSPGDPMPSAPQLFDVTADLKDRQLDVILVGTSTIDYSDLTVRLRD
jgi:hypothetical protein